MSAICWSFAMMSKSKWQPLFLHVKTACGSFAEQSPCPSRHRWHEVSSPPRFPRWRDAAARGATVLQSVPLQHLLPLRLTRPRKLPPFQSVASPWHALPESTLSETANCTVNVSKVAFSGCGQFLLTLTQGFFECHASTGASAVSVSAKNEIASELM